jgi:hypothetical protein
MIAGDNQTWADITLLATGTLENLMGLCAANGVSPSDLPTLGVEVIIPDGVTTDSVTLAFLLSSRVIMGTAVPGVAEAPEPGGHRQHGRNFKHNFK